MAFTSLAVMGAGVAAGPFALACLGLGPWMFDRTQAAAMDLLLGFGLAFSTLHLGQRGKMLYALRRTGRNALSTEVALTATIVAGAAAVIALPLGETTAARVWSITSLSSLALLLLIGLIYRLPGRPSWGAAAVPAPLVLGLIFGLVFESRGEMRVAALILLFVLDFGLYSQRRRGLQASGNTAAAAHPEYLPYRFTILFLRLLLLPLATSVALLLGSPAAAITAAAAGVIADRFAFYALAIRQTTESELSRIEAIIRKQRE